MASKEKKKKSIVKVACPKCGAQVQRLVAAAGTCAGCVNFVKETFILVPSYTWEKAAEDGFVKKGFTGTSTKVTTNDRRALFNKANPDNILPMIKNTRKRKN